MRVWQIVVVRNRKYDVKAAEPFEHQPASVILDDSIRKVMAYYGRRARRGIKP